MKAIIVILGVLILGAVPQRDSTLLERLSNSEQGASLCYLGEGRFLQLRGHYIGYVHVQFETAKFESSDSSVSISGLIRVYSPDSKLEQTRHLLILFGILDSSETDVHLQKTSLIDLQILEKWTPGAKGEFSVRFSPRERGYLCFVSESDSGMYWSEIYTVGKLFD